VASPILVVCNGMDTDGDTLLIFKDYQFNRIVDNTLRKREYPIIINTIESEPDPVELTNANISIIDEKLAKSQRWIGSVTNQAQFLVSTMWDIQRDEGYLGNKEDDIAKIQDSIAILVVLSNVAIDYAKKIVKVDIEDALCNIRKINAAKKPTIKKGKIVRKTRKKPKFWTSVTSSNPETEEFNTPMDMLINHINNDIKKANYRNDISMMELLPKEEEMEDKYDNKQVDDIVDAVTDFNNKMKDLHAKDHLDKDEKYRTLTDAYEKISYKISKKTIKPSTMYRLFQEVQDVLDKNVDNKPDKKKKKVNKEMQGLATHIMNLVYLNDKEKFISLIEKNEEK
jgi:hypothetical protein